MGMNMFLYGSFLLTLVGVVCVFWYWSRKVRRFNRKVIEEQLNMDSLEVLHRGRDISAIAPEHLVLFRLRQYQRDLLLGMERLNLADPLATLGFRVWMYARAAIGRRDNQFIWLFKRFFLAGRDAGAPGVSLGHFQRAHFAYVLERFYHAQPGCTLDRLSDFRAHGLTITDFGSSQDTWFLNLKFRKGEGSLLTHNQSKTIVHTSLSDIHPDKVSSRERRRPKNSTGRISPPLRRLLPGQRF
jgi:hypothetical protein